jgi:hypothetical protein
MNEVQVSSLIITKFCYHHIINFVNVTVCFVNNNVAFMPQYYQC